MLINPVKTFNFLQQARNKKIIGDANRVKSAKTKIQSDLETAFSPFLRKNEQYRTMAMVSFSCRLKFIFNVF